jgi:glycosyltransferase involved in cell wall biosynthesis/peptidoglycan/xylan/chitin deacetylase (PgdA/CDA1 family)
VARPAVSVVIIFLDAERFLQEAIDSVLAQTWTDFELVLVDDGSTDRSGAIAEQAAAADPRVTVLRHPGGENRGMSASRNLGVASSTGDLIAFLDGDDVWHPNKLEEQVALIRGHPDVGMLYGRTLWWYGWTDRPEDEARDYIHDSTVPLDREIDAPTLFARFLTDGTVPPYTCSVLVRREAFERVGGFEDEFRGLYEDQVFFAKIFLNERVFVANRCWDRYRQHENSACALAYASLETHPTDAHPARRAFVEWATRYAARIRPGDPEIAAAVAAAAAPYRYPTAAWEITEVEQLVATGAPGGHIDIPNVGSRTGGAAISVQGWALGEDAPAVAIEVLDGGRVVKRVLVDQPRPDLRAAFPAIDGVGNAGFDVEIVPVGASFRLEVRAVLAGQRRLTLGRVAGRRRSRAEDTAAGTPLVSLIVLSGRDDDPAATVASALAQDYGYTEVVAVADDALVAGLETTRGSLVGIVRPPTQLDPSAVRRTAAHLRANPALRAADDGSHFTLAHRFAVARGPANGRLPLTERGSAVAVLLYHRVADLDVDPWGLAVSPQRFAEQLEAIEDIADPFTARELHDAVAAGRLPRRSVVLTFDDGYEDNLTTAQPLLARHGLPATVFVASGGLGESREYWWDELEQILLQPDDLPEAIELDLPDGPRRVQLGTDREQHPDWRAWQAPPTTRHAAFVELYDLLRPFESARRDAVLDALRVAAAVPFEPRTTHRRLDLDGLARLSAADGIEIGAHTVTHPRLTDASLDEQRYEVEESKRRLEETLSERVASFAYPHGSAGDYSESTIGVVAGAGYAGAFTARDGLVTSAARPFELPRISVGNVSGAELADVLDRWFTS